LGDGAQNKSVNTENENLKNTRSIVISCQRNQRKLVSEEDLLELEFWSIWNAGFIYHVHPSTCYCPQESLLRDFVMIRFIRIWILKMSVLCGEFPETIIPYVIIECTCEQLISFKVSYDMSNNLDCAACW